MSITRKLLKGMGLTEEQQDTILEAHTATLEDIKKERDRYKADADKLPDVEKELNALREAGDGGYKKRYDDEHAAFETYKGEITAKEARSAKEKATRAYYEGKGIKGDNLAIAMKGSAAEIDGIELDGEKIKDTSALDNLVDGTFSGLVSKGTSFDWSSSVGEGEKKSSANETMNALIRGAVK